jgi:hypothetical protein
MLEDIGLSQHTLTKNDVNIRRILLRFGETPRKALESCADIPHSRPDFGAFLSIKPCIPLAQELQQAQVFVGEIEYEEPLARDVEHMHPYEVVEDPPCSRGLCGFAFLVRKGSILLLECAACRADRYGSTRSQ